MRAIHVSGKRKTAIARATIVPGNGLVRVNSQLLTSLPENMFKAKIAEPLLIAGDVAKQVDVSIDVRGGGQNSQAEAARLALARALSTYDKKLHKEFLDYDRTLLIADVRYKEAHKPNRHGRARAKRQKSYR